MRRKSSTPSESEGRIVCRPLTLKELRKVPPVGSGYSTNRVYRIRRERAEDGMTWSLREVVLSRPFVKVYDTGAVDEWLASYEDAGPVHELRFAAAEIDGRVEGLLTWRPVSWNSTTWLVDIRAREESRRKGVGSTLVHFLKQEARTTGSRGILVETQINNYPAVSFYRKHGFEICGFNDHLYTNRDLQEQDVAIFLFWESDGS